MRLLLYFVISLITLSAKASPFMAVTKQQVNLREGAGKDFTVLLRIPANSEIYVYEEETTNDFFNVLYIKTGVEGWVHKDYLRFVKFVKPMEGSPFSEGAYSELLQNCIANIENKTSYTLKLKIDNTTHSFAPHEKKEIQLLNGSHTYHAFCAGVIPLYGVETFNKGYSYDWTFYIRTTIGTTGGYRRYKKR